MITSAFNSKFAMDQLSDSLFQSTISSSMFAADQLSISSLPHSSSMPDCPLDNGRVGKWATSFNMLLQDPAGLHTFSEFLKQEFSQENITFWIACEQYRQLKNPSVLFQMAKEIYTKHLCIGANEPVNVDSYARQIAQEGLDSPTAELFLPAQKQIFNLMKFDCYQRFLKSAMFKECMRRELQGEPLLYTGQVPEVNKLTINKQKKVSTPFKKRTSFIPWHKLNRSKLNESKTSMNRSILGRSGEFHKYLKKKKKERESQTLDNVATSQLDKVDKSFLSNEVCTEAIYKNTCSGESLSSAELNSFPTHCGADCYYCRVVLPDHSTTVVQTEKGETIGEMLLKLLEKRSLTYNAVEAFLVGSTQPLDHEADSTSLRCKEIRVEQVILFCVELPNKKSIGVKAKNRKICLDILKPVLDKYGFKMNEVTLTIASSQKCVDLQAPITTIDNERVLVSIKDLTLPSSVKKAVCNNKNDTDTTNLFPDLEELTNQIFDDLLKCKPDLQNDTLKVVTLARKSGLKKRCVSPHCFHSDTEIGSKCRGSKVFDTIDSRPQIPKRHLTINTKPDSGNSQLMFKEEAKPNMLLKDNDVQFGLASSLQSMEHTPDLLYRTSHPPPNLLSTICYLPNNIKKSHKHNHRPKH